MLDLSVIETRDVTSAELPFVLSKWLKSYKRSPWAGVVPANLYTRVYSDTIQQLINRGMKIRVFAGRGIDTVLGFVAYEQSDCPVVHYAFMKKEYRGYGLFRALCAREGLNLLEPFYYTFRTHSSRKFRAGRHKPHMARQKELSPSPRNQNAEVRAKDSPA